jgi:hypothetical protein
MLATIIDTASLLKTIAASFAAGVGVTLVFSMTIYGVTRFADLSRDQRPLAAALAGAFAVVTFAVCLAAIVLGIIVMTSK